MIKIKLLEQIKLKHMTQRREVILVRHASKAMASSQSNSDVDE